jgi:hypothetical protein
MSAYDQPPSPSYTSEALRPPNEISIVSPDRVLAAWQVGQQISALTQSGASEDQLEPLRNQAAILAEVVARGSRDNPIPPSFTNEVAQRIGVYKEQNNLGGTEGLVAHRLVQDRANEARWTISGHNRPADSSAAEHIERLWGEAAENQEIAMLHTAKRDRQLEQAAIALRETKSTTGS